MVGQQTASLVIGWENKPAERVPLRAERIVLGRTDDADIRVEDPTISRKHAELILDETGRWIVQDLGSRNGTLVNGETIDRRALRGNDLIQLGDVKMRLRLDTPGMSSSVNEAASAIRYLALDNEATSGIQSLSDFATPQIDADRLAEVLAFGSTQQQRDDPRQRMQAVCDIMVGQHLLGWHSFVLKLSENDDGSGAAVLAEAHASQLTSQEQTHLSRTALRAVRDRGEPVMATNVSPAEAQIEMSISPEMMAMGVLVCPLDVDASGGMVVHYTVVPPDLAEPAWLALSQLVAQQHTAAEHAIAAQQREKEFAVIEHDLEKARQVQHSLVPKDVTLTGFELSFGFVPSRWVGGDMLDACMDGESAVVFMADVAGKGLDAALIAASVHTAFRSMLRTGVSLPKLLSCLNEQLMDSLPNSRFVTMLAMRIDPKTGEMFWVNAGHLPPIIIKPDGTARTLPGANHPPVGIFPAEYQPLSDTLAPGETLALYTDGLTELRNEAGEMLYVDGLETMLSGIFQQQDDSPVQEASQTLDKALRAFGEADLSHDDMTHMLVKRIVS